MLDVVVRPLAPWALTSDTPARVRVGRGGSGANIAVALRAAGPSDLDVVFAGVAGDDAALQIVRDDLESAGVVAHLATVEGATGVVVSLVADTGQRAMMTARGVNAELDYAHVAAMLGPSLAHLHVSGYTLLDERTRPLAVRILAAASAIGATTSVDVCSVGPLRLGGVDPFSAAARTAQMLFANEEEALALSGTADVDSAIDRLGRHWTEVVVTRGASGALARRGGRTWRVPATGREVVDTTGAGDGATGTYLAHRLVGADVEVALERAMAAAARVVRTLGSGG